MNLGELYSTQDSTEDNAWKVPGWRITSQESGRLLPLMTMISWFQCTEIPLRTGVEIIASLCSTSLKKKSVLDDARSLSRNFQLHILRAFLCKLPIGSSCSEMNLLLLFDQAKALGCGGEDGSLFRVIFRNSDWDSQVMRQSSQVVAHLTFHSVSYSWQVAWVDMASATFRCL